MTLNHESTMNSMKKHTIFHQKLSRRSLRYVRYPAIVLSLNWKMPTKENYQPTLTTCTSPSFSAFQRKYIFYNSSFHISVRVTLHAQTERDCLQSECHSYFIYDWQLILSVHLGVCMDKMRLPLTTSVKVKSLCIH